MIRKIHTCQHALFFALLITTIVLCACTHDVKPESSKNGNSAMVDSVYEAQPAPEGGQSMPKDTTTVYHDDHISTFFSRQHFDSIYRALKAAGISGFPKQWIQLKKEGDDYFFFKSRWGDIPSLELLDEVLDKNTIHLREKSTNAYGDGLITEFKTEGDKTRIRTVNWPNPTFKMKNNRKVIQYNDYFFSNVDKNRGIAKVSFFSELEYYADSSFKRNFRLMEEPEE